MPAVYNFLAGNPRTAKLIKQLAGFAPDRSLPPIGKTTVLRWYQEKARQGGSFPNGRVYLFCDDSRISTMLSSGLKRFNY
jgi:hypothetical protein